MAHQRETIRKAFLYDDFGGTELLNYHEWAEYHIQDSETALSIAQSMLDSDGRSENFYLDSKMFEVYVITDREGFIEQMNEYENRPG